MNFTLQCKGAFVVLVYLSHVPSYNKHYSTAGRNRYVIRRLNWLLTVFVEVLHMAVRWRDYHILHAQLCLQPHFIP